jgi:hypothetical protein
VIRRLVRALQVLVCSAVFAGVAAAAIQTPEQFLGHRVGADGKLADYSQITRYFEQLDQASDRMAVVKLGPTTLDRTMFMAVISSEANLRNLDRQKEIARRLADPRGLSDAEAERLIAEGKTIVLVSCNIHASEIGASQMAMEWAHQLVTSDDPEVKRRLDDVILLLMPSINPDGTDMIVDYFRKYAGTPWEGGRLPWLYHHYAGHDNNRDWYMLNLRETRMVNRVLHHEWFPQVFLDEHQMGSTGPRIFVPPYADPLTTAVHPLQWRLNDVVGTNMALRLEQQKKSGVIYGYSFDAYWPGGTKNTACLKNVIGLLTEVASCRIASPVWVDASELVGGRKGLPEYRAQVNFPNPWPGGWWRLRDIVDYELIASNSLLETCSRNRAELLRGLVDMANDAVTKGTEGGPYAYVVPARQHDAYAAARMVDILRENGLEAHRARAPITTGDGRVFPAGSTVFLAAQPYRPFLVEMMERQRYPEVRPSTESKDIFRPYDVTAWTLPLLMGVEWARVDDRFDADLEKLDATPWPAGGVTGAGSAALAIDASSHQAAKVVNALLAKKVKVERATAPFTAGGRTYAPGAWLIAGSAASDADRAAKDAHVEVQRLDAMPDVHRVAIAAPRIALYKPWAASMDEGWTRLVFDQTGFKYTNLDNTAIKAGKLAGKYDVILLADIDKNVIVDGKPKAEDGGSGYFEPLPAPYAGGIGKEGVAALKAFVEAGGTLVAFSEACNLPIDEFGIPVRNTAARLKSSDYSVPGTMLNIDLDPTNPLAWGMAEHAAVYHTGGPVLATSVPGANVGRSIAARFVAAKEDLVASGWAAGEEYLAGHPALVEASLGKGRVVLFGFRPQQRAQTVGTYSLVFNALYRATSK